MSTNFLLVKGWVIFLKTEKIERSSFAKVEKSSYIDMADILGKMSQEQLQPDEPKSISRTDFTFYFLAPGLSATSLVHSFFRYQAEETRDEKGGLY